MRKHGFLLVIHACNLYISLLDDPVAKYPFSYLRLRLKPCMCTYIY